MKRQGLIAAAGLGLALAVTVVTVIVLRRTTLGALAPENLVERRLGSARLLVPRQFQPWRSTTPEGWSSEEFRGGSLGTLQLAVARRGETPFEDLCRRYFEMPSFPAGPFTWKTANASWFAKPVRVREDGLYVLRSAGKRLQITLFFTGGEETYWIRLTTRQSLGPVKDLFDAVAVSFRFADGRGPDPGLAAALAPVAREGHYRFVQPVELLLALPALVVGIVLLVLLLVARRAGRLPAPDPAGGEPPAYAEAHVEIGLSRTLQHQFLTGAVVVTAEGLTVHTFGTPFLVVPREACRQARVEGGILGAFVRLPLPDGSGFRKQRWKYGRPGSFSLKIYAREVERLRLALA